MDTNRNWKKRIRTKKQADVWDFIVGDISRGAAARVVIAIGLILLGLLFSAEIVSAEDNRIPAAPPTIMTHTPGRDATQVLVNSAVSVVWDRPMQPDTDFSVTGPEGFISGAFLYDPESYTVTFLPDEDFAPDTRYGVLVAGQVDINGQVQHEPYQWNFDSVTPTSVSIVSFNSADENPLQNWLWSSWPWLMAAVSIFSLAGFLLIWSRRRPV